MKDLKLNISSNEAAVLLEALLLYDVNWLLHLPTRLMVQEQMNKLVKRLHIIKQNGGNTKLKLTAAQAAAWDTCFRDTPAFEYNCEEVAQLYAIEVLRSVTAEVHRYLINVSTEFKEFENADRTLLH